MLRWVGAAGFLFCFAGLFVIDDLYLREPREARTTTGNVVQWDYKGEVHYITKTEDDWKQADWIALFAMFCTVTLGTYLTPDENNKWLKRSKPKS